jgi:hypothetical protein
MRSRVTTLEGTCHMSAPMKVAYLAEGKLYVHDGGQTESNSTLVESPFAQGILDRVERNRERNEWKNGGWGFSASSFMGMGGMPRMPVETRRMRFTGVTSGGDPGQLLYALDTDHVGGLFRRDLVQDHEQRLLHKQQFRARDVARRSSDGMLALSLQQPDGTAHLAVMSAEGRGLKQVTEGDAVDEAASWSEDGKTILFQSAGVGRNAAGFLVALGQYAVQQLDLDAGKVTTLVEDDEFDYLLPRQAGGALYYIRRPYQPGGPPVSPWKVALDILLFPVRLARAIVHFLNFLSLMFSRQPLMTAGGPPKEGPDQRFVMLWGKMIDAEKMLKQSNGDAAGALVPKDWKLIRRAADGREEVFAERVVAYDVAADGSMVYTDGSRVFARAAGEMTWRELLRGKLVERVAIL